MMSMFSYSKGKREGGITLNNVNVFIFVGEVVRGFLPK